MARNEKTSKKVALKGWQVAEEQEYSKKVKSVAASALTQAPDKKKPRKKK